MQFNIFSLFVLTTVAAIACAIARLPIDPVAKGFPIFTLIVCYYGWAVRNRKYADPRVQQPVSRASRAAAYLIPICFDTLLYGYLLFLVPLFRQSRFWLLWYGLAIVYTIVTGVRLWSAFRPDPQLPVELGAAANPASRGVSGNDAKT